MCAKSFAWAEAWLILSSIKKTVLEKGRGSCVGREGPSAGAPHLSQPHPFHLMHKPPPPSKPLAPKPACLSQQVLITSLHGRWGSRAQGVMGVMEGSPWPGQGPTGSVAEGSGWAASSVRGQGKEEEDEETGMRPWQPCAQEAAFRSRQAGGHARGRPGRRVHSPGFSAV